VLELQNEIPCMECEIESHGSDYIKMEPDDYREFNDIFELLKLKKKFQFEVNMNELINTFNQTIPCITCRSTTEKLYKQLISNKEESSMSLDPLVIESNGVLKVKPSLMNPKSLFNLFKINRFDKLVNYVFVICFHYFKF
jgi:hypothetical protein